MHSQKTRQTAEDPGLKRERARRRRWWRGGRRRKRRERREAGCLKVPKRARKKDKSRPASLTEERRTERRALRAHVDQKRTARVPGSFPREEWRWTQDRKRERVRRGNRWMGLAAYPANAPSDIAVTLLWRARGYDVVVVKSGISVRSLIRLSSRLKIRLVSHEIENRVRRR